MNDQITAKDVRLVGEDGEMFGVVSLAEALDQAAKAGMDLMEISPNAEPPVCKLLDFGKFKYQQQKKKADAKKKQKVVEVKEIKVRPGIEDHDFQTKLRAVKKFLEEGDKVKVSMRFRGREMAHQDIAQRVFDRLIAELGEELAKVDQQPKLEGRQMIMLLSSLVK